MMENTKAKKRIFWGMLVAGCLWSLSVLVTFLDSKVLPQGDTLVAIFLVAGAFLFKWQQKI
jgi:hypothetical protein